jgi:hypothetical protein
MSEDKPWQPPAIPAKEFHNQDQWVNINHAPYDVVSGVIYKPAGSIKSVRYEPLDEVKAVPTPWHGTGSAVVKWLFSELAGTEEKLLNHAEFLYLHDIVLGPGASSGQKRHTDNIGVIYIISGEGTLHHAACVGCPVVARPLRVGDAALIQAGEYYGISNVDSETSLRFMRLGLKVG